MPHPAYLVTLVCGPFAEIEATARPRPGCEVYYYVPPGREADARRSFGRTPEMIDFFSKRIGVPYPHRRYSQIVVADFIFGGMENTTATTLTDQALLDERAALDHDVEALVAHELAHQWWGDLLDLPRVARGLAERGLRHLLRIRLARIRPRPRRGRRRAAERHRDLPGRSGQIPAADRLPAVRRADRAVRRAPVRQGRPRPAHAAPAAGRRAPSGRRSRPTPNATRTARSRPAIWSAPSKRSRAATSIRSSTSGSARPATPSWRPAGAGTTSAAWAA